MARPLGDNLHSRLVAILKVALPLLALAILSSLFLFSRGINPEDAIPYADVDIADRLREPRMTGAGYSGMTEDGASLSLSAAEAVPGVDGKATARGVIGTLETPDGAKTQLAAVSVRLEQTTGMLELSDGVELTTSAGLVVQAQGFGVATDRTLVESRGSVSASGPIGQLTAGAVRLSRSETPEGAANYVLVFNNGVRLLYQPQQ
ncbi:MAG: hypothetical protein A3D16_05980 [Rhodobacterales bacterium RIFCSPHIGHO2_02_FULL_62_130]|jgi:lipopolysaccharide export system protein LptC|nr:MAG: hypothetical protein A3D16_05980 [Rhodobacterales bacterium RIFCSPHIGHO2_02_FULL_62_130]OHC56800.1 MAG: hypothetical protein A3E48_07690 [Rhodobacterales bacterium RIFCSPHIGHO2_12_FULL_62_75]HCZ00322.1 hypothetical protein [Rhodobacter sp.]